MVTIVTKPGFCSINGEAVGALPQDCQGLSTDPKPSTVLNGAIFYEMDTKKAFMFDADGKKWYEV